MWVLLFNVRYERKKQEASIEACQLQQYLSTQSFGSPVVVSRKGSTPKAKCLAMAGALDCLHLQGAFLVFCKATSVQFA